jgi:hypothetical protein
MGATLRQLHQEAAACLQSNDACMPHRVAAAAAATAWGPEQCSCWGPMEAPLSPKSTPLPRTPLCGMRTFSSACGCPFCSKSSSITDSYCSSSSSSSSQKVQKQHLVTHVCTAHSVPPWAHTAGNASNVRQSVLNLMTCNSTVNCGMQHSKNRCTLHCCLC